MKDALNWWYNVLSDYGRSQFPTPKNNDDILAYYEDPVWWSYMEFGQHYF